MSKSKVFKLIIIILSVLLAASVIANAVLGFKYYKGTQVISDTSEQLAKEKEAVLKEIEEKEKLKKEYSDLSAELEKHDEENKEKIDELNGKISELDKQIDNLNKQLAAKKDKNTNLSPTPVTPEPIPSEGKIVYLTFDDGPSSCTPQILDTLDSYGVKATFFVKNGGKYNYLMKDIVDRGNSIGLHTYTHEYSQIYASDSAYFEDLNKISDLVFEQTGVRTNIIRFPGGSSNTVSRKYCSGIMSRLSKSVGEQGYVYFDWNCSNGDADGANTTEKQLKYCSQFSKSASRVIVLMHDTKKVTMNSLPKIIEYYKSCGFTFGVLDETVAPIHHRINN